MEGANVMIIMSASILHGSASFLLHIGQGVESSSKGRSSAKLGNL
jgi:hypothetical protein